MWWRDLQFHSIFQILMEAQMKQIALGLSFVLAAMSARAQESILPEDFFISGLGKLSDTTRINPGMSTVACRMRLLAKFER